MTSGWGLGRWLSSFKYYLLLLRAFVLLPRTPGLQLLASSRKSNDTLFWALPAPYTSGAHKYVQASIHRHKMKEK